MVFPSLMFQMDQGLVSQISVWAVVAFSFVLYRFKKIILTLFAILIAVVVFQSKASAIGAIPSYNQSSCMIYRYCANNYNYYGQAWGYNPPVYMYPQLPFQSFWPQQYYFGPHSPSPYQSYDCPFCNQQNVFQQQSFPSLFQHPGGGAS